MCGAVEIVSHAAVVYSAGSLTAKKSIAESIRLDVVVIDGNNHRCDEQLDIDEMVGNDWSQTIDG